MTPLVKKLEAVLFYLAEPVGVDFLAKTLGESNETVLQAIGELGVELQSRGLRLVFHDNEVSLVTAPEFSEVVEQIVRAERERDLGRAALETLAIVAYKGPVSRKEIEYVRGVNCQFALRTLLLRGLIQKSGAEHDERVMVYTVTEAAIRHLGISHISELPEYEIVRSEIAKNEESEEETGESEEE